MKKRVLLLAASLLISGCKEKTQPSVVDELLTAFEGGCSASAWTSTALERSSRLSSVYKSLGQRASCQNNANLADAIGGASTLHQTLSDALEGESYYRSERVAEENSHDLFLLIQDPSLDPAIQGELLAYYADQRYQVSMNRAQLNYLENATYKSRGASGLARISSFSQGLMASSGHLAACLADNPAKAFDIAANLALIGGAFAPPLVGLGMASVSELLRVGVEAATTFPAAEALYESRKERMPAALICGLEALTRDYCTARDAQTFNDLPRREEQEPIPFFNGIELSDRDLPVLYAWLDKVVGGASSVNSVQADQVNWQFSRLNRIGQIRRNAEGILGELQKDVKNASFTDADRLLKVKEALANLIIGALFSQNGPGIPYAYPDGPFVSDSGYVLVAKIAGISPAPDRVQGEPIPEYIDRLKLEYSQQLIEGIVNRTQSLIADREKGVIKEFIAKVNIMPSLVVRDATTETSGGISAKSALERLEGFFTLYAFGSSPMREQDAQLIQQIKGKLDSLYQSLTQPDATQEEKAANLISNVFTDFKLENTNVFLPTYIQTLVRNDLTTRFRRGEGPQSIEDILLTAGRDIDTLLQQSSLGRGAVGDDLSRAQSTTQGTLANFRNFFADSIGVTMATLKARADANGEPPVSLGSRSPNRHTLSQLCVLTLLSGMEWPAKADRAHCRGTKIFSRDAKLELSFDELSVSLGRKSLDDRLCLHHKFRRLDRLAGQNLSAPGGRRIGRALLTPERSLWQRAVDSLVE